MTWDGKNDKGRNSAVQLIESWCLYAATEQKQSTPWRANDTCEYHMRFSSGVHHAGKPQGQKPAKKIPRITIAQALTAPAFELRTPEQGTRSGWDIS